MTRLRLSIPGESHRMHIVQFRGNALLSHYARSKSDLIMPISLCSAAEHICQHEELLLLLRSVGNILLEAPFNQ